MTQVENQYDVIIVGAGISGATLGYSLAKDGRKVLIVERDLSEPDTFRGELLQPGGVIKLNELGLGHCLDGIEAQPCYGYVVYKPTKTKDSASTTAQFQQEHVAIDYPKWNEAETKPASGKAFHHGRFIMNLRRAATSCSNVTIVEGTVLELTEKNDTVVGISYKPKNNPSEIVVAKAPLTVDCSGAFSKLRKHLQADKPTYTSHFVALLMHDIQLPYPSYGYVILCNPAPILCYTIGPNDVRVLVNVADPLPSNSNGDLRNYMLQTILPQLPDFMVGPFKAACEHQLRSVPCLILHPSAIQRKGALCIGDSLNMRHPLTGGGMTVAFTDVELLTRLLRKVSDLSDYKAVHYAIQPFYNARKDMSATINILSVALFDVFCGGSKTPALAPVQQACFEYFPKYGTPCLGLLAGLNPSPFHLIGHFFTVALIAAKNLLLPIPTPSNLKRAFDAFWASFWVIEPLLWKEWLRTQVSNGWSNVATIESSE